MIPGLPSVPRWRASPEDRAARELRAYLRQENNAEVGWLHAQTRQRREPLGRRLLAWLRRRTSRAFAGRTAVTPQRRASGNDSPAAGSELDAIPLEPQSGSISFDECEHEDSIALGSGGGTSYGQCSECGGVLVIQGGRVWVLRPKAVALRTEELPFATKLSASKCRELPWGPIDIGHKAPVFEPPDHDSS